LVHGDDRGIPAVLVEIRNDGLADGTQVELWARRLAAILAPEPALP
jgi:predicted N-formylglutamate amidohydrolase